MKKRFIPGILLLFLFSLFICSEAHASQKKGKAPVLKAVSYSAKKLAQYTQYGVVPKGKYWMLYSAENRSAAGVFYYINGKPESVIYVGADCHPYCFKNWPDGRKLSAGESVGVPGGNGIYYQYNEYPVGG